MLSQQGIFYASHIFFMVYNMRKNKIAENDYKSRGCDISADEIFVSDGAKSDSGNIGDIFSVDNKIAVCDPVYPVYVDTNAMSGRTGDYLVDQQKWSNVIYMPCTEATNFATLQNNGDYRKNMNSNLNISGSLDYDFGLIQRKMEQRLWRKLRIQHKVIMTWCLWMCRCL